VACIRLQLLNRRSAPLFSSRALPLPRCTALAQPRTRRDIWPCRSNRLGPDTMPIAPNSCPRSSGTQGPTPCLDEPSGSYNGPARCQPKQRFLSAGLLPNKRTLGTPIPYSLTALQPSSLTARRRLRLRCDLKPQRRASCGRKNLRRTATHGRRLVDGRGFRDDRRKTEGDKSGSNMSSPNCWAPGMGNYLLDQDSPNRNAGRKGGPARPLSPKHFRLYRQTHTIRPCFLTQQALCTCPRPPLLLQSRCECLECPP
jgi:hypothetical protein